MLESTRLGEADRRYHLHSQTNPASLAASGPLIMVSGKGPYVTDESGKTYIEGMSGLWCASLGFSNDRIAEVARRQLSRLGFYHTFSQKVSDVTVALAEEIAGIAPMQDVKTFFASSGSEANDTMVKFSWAYHRARGNPHKRKFLARFKGYHGSTVMAASLCGLPSMHEAFGLPLEGANVIHLTCPHFYRQAAPDESEAAFTQRLIDELDQTIEREGADTIAAYIAEPIMGAGGVITPPKGYFEAVQERLKRSDILFLADEIICGFGRTGNWFGSTTYNIVPDMLSCGKSLSAGFMPISAVVVSKPVTDVISAYFAEKGNLGHGFTHSGHPVAAAVACETIRIYRDLNVPARVGSLASHMHDRLKAVIGAHPLVGEIRGNGLLAGIELVAQKESRAPFASDLKVGARVEEAARKEGIIIRNMGDTIALCPPYVIELDELDELIARLGRALDTVELGLSTADRAA